MRGPGSKERLSVSCFQTKLLPGRILIFIGIVQGLMSVVRGAAQLAFFQVHLTQEKGCPEGTGMTAEAFYPLIPLKKVLPGHLHLAREQGFITPAQKMMRIHKTALCQEWLNLVGQRKQTPQVSLKKDSGREKVQGLPSLFFLPSGLKALLCPLEELLGTCPGSRRAPIGCKRQSESRSETEVWLGLQHLIWYASQPGVEQMIGIAKAIGSHKTLDQRRCTGKILAPERCLNCFREQLLLFIPLTRFAVKPAYSGWAQAAAGFVLHRLRPQCVIAIPLPVFIQGLEKEIGPFQLFQQTITIFSVSYGIAE